MNQLKREQLKGRIILLLILVVLGFPERSNKRTIAEEATEAYLTNAKTLIWVTTSIDTDEWYTENTYTVTLTVQVKDFGNDVDRLFDIYIWARTRIDTSTLDDRGPTGPYELLTEGASKTVSLDFKIDPKRYELEEPGYYYDNVKIEYYIAFWEGVVGWFDSEGSIGWDYGLLVDIISPYPPSLSMSSSVTPSTVGEGDSCTLRVTVENTGDLPAEGVIIRLSLPAGLSATSISQTIGLIEAVGMEETSFQIQADQAGSYSIPISITADNAESTSITQTVNVLTPPQLSITANLLPSTITAGESTTLTVEIANSGEQTAENVKITITLPPGLSMPLPTRTVGNVKTTRQETFNITGDASGTYTVTVAVEASNAQVETTTATLVVEERGISGFTVIPVILGLVVIGIVAVVRKRQSSNR